MSLPCGCVGQCSGHRIPSTSSVSTPAGGGLHAPSLLDAGARFVTGLFERKMGKEPGAIYDRGLGDVVRAVVNEHPAIPQERLTLTDLLRRGGVLPEKQNNPPRKKRSVR